MNLRGVEHSSKVTAPEAKEQVRFLLAHTEQLPIVNLPREQVTNAEMQDLVWRMFNMFRAIFATDIAESQARNRAVASVMRFLCKIESLDSKLKPKRAKPIWIAKFNFLGLLRICESFVLFRHVRNMYEGGIVGEGIVKVLRPLVSKGVHDKWAANLLMKYYRQFTLDLLIQATEGDLPKRLKCPLGENVESSKFKRYTTVAEVIDQIQKGQPLPILLFGSPVEWRAGVIIVASNRWYFRELECGIGEDVLDDPYGLAYHRIHLREYEDCFGRVNGDFTQSLGGLPFWDYGIVLPDIIEDVQVFRYGILRSNWQYLDRNCNWSQFD